MPIEPMGGTMIADGVAEIVIDGPPVNAVGTRLLDELIAERDRAGSNDTVRALVLASARPGASLLGLTNVQGRWRRPTRIGDTLPVEAEVTDLKAGSKPDRGVVTLRRTAINQDSEAAMISDWDLICSAPLPPGPQAKDRRSA